MILVAIIAIAAIILDQIVKIWAQGALPTQPGMTIPVIPNVFHFTYVENRGAAFGMLQGKQIVFFIVTLAVVIGVVWYLIKHRKTINRWTQVALALLLAGAIGNTIDRIQLGYVRDMFDFRLINFWVFNVADICVVVSVIMLFIELIRSEKREKETKTEESK